MNEATGASGRDWLSASIMYERGLAKGRTGALHELTEERQGRYH
jgi:hypothetical protein